MPGASVQAFLSLAHSLGVSGFSEDAEAAEQDKENTVQVRVVNNIPCKFSFGEGLLRILRHYAEWASKHDE